MWKIQSKDGGYREQLKRISGARLMIIIISVAALYASLIFNFYKLQIEKGQDYAARAAGRSQLSGYLDPPRGQIYFTDKFGNQIPVALNKTYPVIFVVPREIEDPAESASRLGDIMNIETSKLMPAFSKKNDPYELIAKKATPEQIRAVEEASIRGIYVDDSDYRFYPFGALASQLLGYVGSGSDDQVMGRYGVEAFFDKTLGGQAGKIEGEKVRKSLPGEDVVLTIDRNIQARAEEILGDIVSRFKATGGNIIVEEPKTGKILAMASAPTFDPNDYASAPVASFLNSNVSAVYEPGSIFKVFTMAAGLDAGKITPETRYYDTGSLVLNGKTIRNWDLKAYGSMTMTEVIEHSLNTGAAFAEARLGHDNFYKYLQKFGFKDKTGIDLPGEVIGSLKNLESNKRDISFATASYGQGVSVTPLMLANSFSAIANGGLLMRPYINAGSAPLAIRHVISEDAAKKVGAMMISAVQKAKVADIPKYTVAAKTGTAQVPDFKHGGYSEEVIDTYAGYAPASDPRFVIMVKLDEPRGAPLAGATVVPAFRELAEFILNYYNIAPDRK